VPEVLALDTSERIFPGRFAIFESAHGCALADTSLDEALHGHALEQAGRAIRLVHEVRVRGFGPLDDEHYLESGEVRGEHDSWAEYARDRAIDAIPVLRDTQLIDAHTAATYERAFAGVRDIWEFQDTRLVHGDFDQTHIFVDPATGELTSIIDWGDREASDPAWELGVFLQWDGPTALGDLLRGYAPDASDRDALMPRARLYALVLGLGLAARRSRQDRTDDARSTLAEMNRAIVP
jgi:aminoglycoside phosphotransferase (APT) family kinase protein